MEKDQLRALALCLLVVVARGWGRLVHAEIWAEDGSVFLTEGLAHGWGSLLLPHLGSYHTLQRVIVLGSVRLLPLAWLPGAICAVCFVVLAYVASLVGRRSYEWLIPSPGARLLTAVMLCMVPGLTEMLGNLANLNWILFGWLALIGLKDPSEPISWWEIVIALVVVASVGTFILIIPLYSWRLWYAWRERTPREGRAHAATILVLLLAGTAWLILSKADRPAPPRHAIGDVLLTYYAHFVRHVFLQPWVGDQIALKVGKGGVLFGVVQAMAGLFLVLWTRRHHREPRCQAMLVFLVPLSQWTILCWLTRVAPAWEFFKILPDYLFRHRYSFPLGFGGILFWMVVLGPTVLLVRRRPAAALVFAALYLTLSISRFTIPAYGEERYWRSYVGRLEGAITRGCPKELSVPIYPDGWWVGYTSKSAGGCGSPYDGDRRADLAFWRPSDGTWHVLKSAGSYSSAEVMTCGTAGDVPVPGDYDGDGSTDVAVWRPSTGTWYTFKSTGGYAAVEWGSNAVGDVPVPGDYDGDGKTDLAVWRSSTGTWHILKSSGGSAAVQWGSNAVGDVPVPGDYDRDGKTDLAVWQSSTGTWHILKSSGGSVAVQWGSNAAGDVPVPGDYDGDGKTDLAVWQSSTGTWHILKSSGGSAAVQWGSGHAGDIPVPSDYDGDGRVDPAVWRRPTGMWFVLRSGGNYTSSFHVRWGTGADTPVPEPAHPRRPGPGTSHVARHVAR